MKGIVGAATMVAILATGLVCADEADRAVGIWKSISDVKGEEGKVTAYWKLAVTNGALQGVIVLIPGHPDDSTYDCVKKELNGKPLVGTPWITDMTKTGPDSWGGGSIVDVATNKGDVYRCKIKVRDGGKVLELRGFIGVSFLGRSQFWQLSNEAELKAAREENKAKLAK